MLQDGLIDCPFDFQEDVIEITLQQKKLKEFGVSDLLAVKDIADLVSKMVITFNNHCLLTFWM